MEVKRKIEIKHCHRCVFANYEIGFGYSFCNLYELDLENVKEGEIHKDCKLDKEELSFKLVN